MPEGKDPTMEQLQTTRINIGSLSRQILQNFTQKERKDGSTFWDLRNDIEWQHQLAIEACEQSMLSPESYATIFKILIEIYVAENREQAEDFLYDIEPYAEVADLTAWLNAAPENVDYLTEAICQGTAKNGVEALAKAHKLFLIDIGMNLIEALAQHVAKEAASLN